MIVIVANPCTSILSGFAVFSVLGHLSHEAGVPIEAITDSGKTVENPFNTIQFTPY